MKQINFDMDGTIAGFYDVENWLDYLLREKTKPYRVAKPLVNMRQLGKEIHRLQNLGYSVGIISWGSKGARDTYNQKIRRAKLNWLHEHLGSVTFDRISIVPYGTPKSTLGHGVLFDDEERNRKEWFQANDENFAFDVNNIIGILKGIKAQKRGILFLFFFTAAARKNVVSKTELCGCRRTL